MPTLESIFRYFKFILNPTHLKLSLWSSTTTDHLLFQSSILVNGNVIELVSQTRKKPEIHLWLWLPHPTPPIQSFKSCWHYLLNAIQISPFLSFFTITVVQTQSFLVQNKYVKTDYEILYKLDPFKGSFTLSSPLHPYCLLSEIQNDHVSYCQPFTHAVLSSWKTVLSLCYHLFYQTSTLFLKKKKQPLPDSHFRRGPHVL